MSERGIRNPKQTRNFVTEQCPNQTRQRIQGLLDFPCLDLFPKSHAKWRQFFNREIRGICELLSGFSDFACLAYFAVLLTRLVLATKVRISLFDFGFEIGRARRTRHDRHNSIQAIDPHPQIEVFSPRRRL
jgi:hypothetical protein